MRDELPRVTTIRAATDHLLLPPEGQNDACGECIGEERGRDLSTGGLRYQQATCRKQLPVQLIHIS